MRGLLAHACQLGLDDQALRVVGQRASLQADYAPASDRLGDVVGVGVDYQLLEDRVGVGRAVRVGKDNFIAVLKLIEIPEDQVALRGGEAEAVSGYVDVGATLPRKTSVPEVERSVVQRPLARCGGVVYRHLVYPLHLGDGER